LEDYSPEREAETSNTDNIKYWMQLFSAILLHFVTSLRSFVTNNLVLPSNIYVTNQQLHIYKHVQ